MSVYHIKFVVNGGCEKDNFFAEDSTEATSLRELAEQTWSTYRQALYHIWKRLEMGIFMEPNPNPVLSIECSKDGQPVNEQDVHEAFFSIRVENYNEYGYKPREYS